MLDWKKRESLLSKFLTRKHTYHQDILSFCSFVYNNYLFLCSSVENSAFREIYGRSTGYVREMFEQHLPLLKPFTHRCFTHFTGNVAQFCEIHDKYVEPHKILLHSLGTFETILYLCKRVNERRCQETTVS